MSQALPQRNQKKGRHEGLHQDARLGWGRAVVHTHLVGPAATPPANPRCSRCDGASSVPRCPRSRSPVPPPPPSPYPNAGSTFRPQPQCSALHQQSAATFMPLAGLMTTLHTQNGNTTSTAPFFLITPFPQRFQSSTVDSAQMRELQAWPRVRDPHTLSRLTQSLEKVGENVLDIPVRLYPTCSDSPLIVWPADPPRGSIPSHRHRKCNTGGSRSRQ
jgi:hypothetical protein